MIPLRFVNHLSIGNIFWYGVKAYFKCRLSRQREDKSSTPSWNSCEKYMGNPRREMRSGEMRVLFGEAMHAR
jgi:hypothetical protein